MNFQQSLHKILGNPNFNPPECLLDLDFKGFEELLASCSKEVCISFAVSEAKLVLPIFEAEFPNDDRPRKAILIAERRLRNHPNTVPTLDGMPSVCPNAFYTCASIVHAITYDHAAYAAYCVAISAQEAYSGITLEDQLRRLFEIL